VLSWGGKRGITGGESARGRAARPFNPWGAEWGGPVASQVPLGDRAKASQHPPWRTARWLKDEHQRTLAARRCKPPVTPTWSPGRTNRTTSRAGCAFAPSGHLRKARPLKGDTTGPTTAADPASGSAPGDRFESVAAVGIHHPAPFPVSAGGWTRGTVKAISVVRPVQRRASSAGTATWPIVSSSARRTRLLSAS